MTVSTQAKGKTLTGTLEYQTFVEGEIVVLNSGGPNMTIVDVLDDTDEVIVAFGNEGEIEMFGFPTACVRKVVTN